MKDNKATTIYENIVKYNDELASYIATWRETETAISEQIKQG